MCVVCSGDACITCCLITGALNRCDAIIDVVVVCLLDSLDVFVVGNYVWKLVTSVYGMFYCECVDGAEPIFLVVFLYVVLDFCLIFGFLFVLLLV